MINLIMAIFLILISSAVFNVNASLLISVAIGMYFAYQAGEHRLLDRTLADICRSIKRRLT